MEIKIGPDTLEFTFQLSFAEVAALFSEPDTLEFQGCAICMLRLEIYEGYWFTCYERYCFTCLLVMSAICHISDMIATHIHSHMTYECYMSYLRCLPPNLMIEPDQKFQISGRVVFLLY